MRVLLRILGCALFACSNDRAPYDSLTSVHVYVIESGVGGDLAKRNSKWGAMSASVMTTTPTIRPVSGPFPGSLTELWVRAPQGEPIVLRLENPDFVRTQTHEFSVAATGGCELKGGCRSCPGH